MMLCRLYTNTEHGSCICDRTLLPQCYSLGCGSANWAILVPRGACSPSWHHETPSAMTELFLYFGNLTNKYLFKINWCFLVGETRVNHQPW